MQPPRTRYAKSGDVSIAYQVIGDAPLTLVYAPGWISHVEVMWEDPNFAQFMTRLAEITDGTSQTIMVIEYAGRPTLWRAGRSVPGIYVTDAAWVGGPITFGQGSTRDGVTKPGPCAINCTNNREAYSFHPAGANTVFADGSLRFLKAKMDIRFFARLATRAGGEVVKSE